jgi:NADH:ubiquinone oxidoreductase subunit H
MRLDQLTSLSWKLLTPVALFVLIICSIWKLLL